MSGEQAVVGAIVVITILGLAFGLALIMTRGADGKHADSTKTMGDAGDELDDDFEGKE